MNTSYNYADFIDMELHAEVPVTQVSKPAGSTQHPASSDTNHVQQGKANPTREKHSRT